MSYRNDSIYAPVSIYDVQRCFGKSATDLGTLITQADINKWAKYKPVRLATIDTVRGQWDTVNKTWLSTATWWRSDGLCGLSTETATEFGNSLTNQNSFMYKLTHGQLGWTYNRPTGGTQQPFRLQDFASYLHGAIPPYGEIGNTDIYIDQQGRANMSWEIVDVDSRNLSLSDFIVDSHPLTDFYLGIILWKNSTWHLYTSSQKFSTGQALDITITEATSLEGEWNLMPFFSLKQVNSEGSFDANGLFISMADTTPMTIKLSTDGSVYYDLPTATWNAAGTAATFEVSIANETSSEKTMSGVMVSIYGDSAAGTLLGSTEIQNVTINAKSIRTLTGTITATKGGYGSYWVVVRDMTTGSTISNKYNQVEDYDGMID